MQLPLIGVLPLLDAGQGEGGHSGVGGSAASVRGLIGPGKEGKMWNDLPHP